MLNTILSNTYTTHDLKHRLRILRSYLEKKLFGNIEADDFSPDDLAWLNSLGENFYTSFTKENLYLVFKDLEKESQKLTSLILYLAFEAQTPQIESISQWLRKNLQTKLIFEVKIDPDLLGGTALVYKGVYKDYSLRAKIQEQAQTILAEFKKYVR